jgi:hypothetical protein
MEYNNCNNCGKKGHIFNQCKMPITSIGIIAIRKNPTDDSLEYCMICRRNTLGFMDFIRGKYSVFNQYHISNMIKQMTQNEKEMLKTMEFDDIWDIVWGTTKKLCSQYRNEEHISREKFNQFRNGIVLEPDNLQLPPGLVRNMNDISYNSCRSDLYTYNLYTIIDSCEVNWVEPEWGFPKGRRNFNENDLDCGLREFSEETGYICIGKKCKVIQNVFPFEEIFIGSNYKSYKHKYFLMFMDYDYSIQTMIEPISNCEISRIEWKTLDNCVSSIRPYNLEKKQIVVNVNSVLLKYNFI